MPSAALLEFPVVCSVEDRAANDRPMVGTPIELPNEMCMWDVFEAIRLANPGGLGEVDEMDIRDAPPADCAEVRQTMLAGRLNSGHGTLLGSRHINDLPR